MSDARQDLIDTSLAKQLEKAIQRNVALVGALRHIKIGLLPEDQWKEAIAFIDKAIAGE